MLGYIQFQMSKSKFEMNVKCLNAKIVPFELWISFGI
jgi:hypothetical protein